MNGPSMQEEVIFNGACLFPDLRKLFFFIYFLELKSFWRSAENVFWEVDKQIMCQTCPSIYVCLSSNYSQCSLRTHLTFCSLHSFVAPKRLEDTSSSFRSSFIVVVSLYIKKAQTFRTFHAPEVEQWFVYARFAVQNAVKHTRWLYYLTFHRSRC